MLSLTFLKHILQMVSDGKYTGAHVYVSYHSECLGLVDCRQPGADYVDSASWTALWEQRILGQQVKGGMTREHLQKSEYTM